MTGPRTLIALTRSPRRLRGPYESPWLQGGADFLAGPRVEFQSDTAKLQGGSPFEAPDTSTVHGSPEAVVVPKEVPEEYETADAAVIQIWEGTVLSVDEARSTIRAKLEAKIGSVPEHVGDVSFEWVSDQDRDLVAPGAVFYLTLFKKRKRSGTIQNSQELRFRRRPGWSKQQLEQVNAAAEEILRRMKPK